MTQKNCRKVIILKAIFGCKFNYEMFELPIFCKMSLCRTFLHFLRCYTRWQSRNHLKISGEEKMIATCCFT